MRRKVYRKYCESNVVYKLVSFVGFLLRLLKKVMMMHRTAFVINMRV